MKHSRSRAKQCALLLTALLSVSMLTACDGNPGSTPSTDSITSESSADSTNNNDSSNQQAESTKPADSKTTTPTDGTKVTEESSQKDNEPTATTAKANGNNTQQNPATKPANEQSQANANANPSTTTDAPDDEDSTVKEIKYIYLKGSTAQYNGSGISVTGSKITISKGGTYVISGTLDNGQIYIFTDDKKVRLQLDNCSITNQAGSAINCQQAKKVTLETLAGTTNSLADGGTHDTDKGTVFSEDTVVLTGEGTLNIKANYAHGIQSDDDIVVNGGNIHIESAKSCLHSNDGIDINGGKLYCDGGTNGIKTDGYINITGGDSTFIGGIREEKGAVYCDGVFAVTGGSFRAIGNTCTKPNPTATTVPVIGAVFSATQPGNTQVRFTCGGTETASFTSPRTFKYALYAGSNLSLGKEYAVTYGDSNGGTFTANGNVTLYNVPLN